MSATSTTTQESIRRLDALHAWQDLDRLTRSIHSLFSYGNYANECLLVAMAEGRTESLPEAADDYRLRGPEELRASLRKHTARVQARMPEVIEAWERFVKAVDEG